MSLPFDFKKFENKREAKEFCLSMGFFLHLKKLKEVIPVLEEKAKHEIVENQGMGMPKGKTSEVILSYLENEIDRLEMLHDYFMGKPARPQRSLAIVHDGKENDYEYEWTNWDDHGLGNILYSIKKKNE